MDEIAPGIFVATSPVYLTTTTVVTGADGGCLVIDPALTATEVAGLAHWLDDRGLRAVAGWSTHPHWDHVLWAAALGPAVPRYATRRAVSRTVRHRQEMIEELAGEAPGHDLDLFARLLPLPGRGEVVPWDGPEARVHSHDAYAPGHGAIFLPGPGVLVAGDMLSDVEIPLLDLASADDGRGGAVEGSAAGDDVPDPFGAYRAGLGLLASLGTAAVRHLVPGHGHVAGAAPFGVRVAADFRYLDAVESGRNLSDQRLLAPEAGWLRAEHARHLELARRELGGFR